MLKKLSQILTLLFAFFITQQSNADFFNKNKPSYLPTEEAFVLTTQQNSDQNILLYWQIAPNYYIYNNSLKIKGNNKELDFKVLSKSELHLDEFFGETYIYRQQLEINVPHTQQLSVQYQGCTKGFCYPPVTKVFNFNKTPNKQAVTSDKKFANSSQDPTAISEQDKIAQNLEKNPISLFWFLILGMGLALTPCVLPMLPLLSAIVIGQNNRPKGKRAFVLSLSYVQGMAIVYTLLGLVVVALGLPFQAALQSPAVLITLSVVFIFFALSMFGLFTLQLPNSIQQKLNSWSQSQQSGSLKGAFIMGMIAGLVASPCTTAPLSGALLYVAQTGNLWIGASALYLLALGMGIPLILITLFGNKILPKSGEWLLKVKTTFGFVMLALPIFLLSRVLPHYAEPLMWSALAIAFLIWLNFQFPANKWWQKALHLALLIGMIICVKPYFNYFSSDKVETTQHSTNQFVHIKNFADLQHNLTAYKGKKVMLDLYADWCVACKEFEKYTFTNKGVQQKFQDMVILQADLSQNNEADQELMKKLNVYGLPSILFFNEQGEELTQKRVTGFMEADKFLDWLNKL